MSQSDQKQDESRSRLEKPFFGMRILGTEDYHIDKVYDLQRWMCPNCGLILDYQFNHEEPGWPRFDPEPYDGWVEIDEEVYEHWVKEESRELCSRCGVDFSERPLLPVNVSQYILGPFPKLTFVVEDEIQKKVIESIARELKKEVKTIVAHGSANVESFFKVAKDQGSLTNGFFLIDGDNRGNPHPKEPNFIQLEKYCIDNYLLDFDICASISGKTVKQVQAIVFNIIKGYFKGKDSFLNFLFSRFSEADITEASLSNIDASQILKRVHSNLGIKDQDDFIEKYVGRCKELSKLEIALPSRIVEVIQNA